MAGAPAGASASRNFVEDDLSQLASTICRVPPQGDADAAQNDEEMSEIDAASQKAMILSQTLATIVGQTLEDTVLLDGSNQRAAAEGEPACSAR